MTVSDKLNGQTVLQDFDFGAYGSACDSAMSLSDGWPKKAVPSRHGFEFGARGG